MHFLAFSRDSTGLVSLHLHWSSWQHQGQVEENKLFAFTANWGPFAVECAGLKFNHNMRLHHHRTMHKVFCGKFKSGIGQNSLYNYFKHISKRFEKHEIRVFSFWAKPPFLTQNSGSTPRCLYLSICCCKSVCFCCQGAIPVRRKIK